jgi:CDP-diacylglycerol--serine O-phosphatidyltransferase
MLRDFQLADWFTLGNAFCGTGAIFAAMRFLQDGVIRDLMIGMALIPLAFIFDALDGRVARWRKQASVLGRELDSLADVISFGIAPAILAFAWGLHELGRWGWAIGFLFVAAAALRLARFNIQTGTGGDKRYFIGMPSPSAASVPAATVFAWPYQIDDWRAALLVVPVVVVPALLMVSTVRFRSFKDLNLGWRRSYMPLFLTVLVIVAVAAEPRIMLPVCAYTYLLSALAGLAVSRFRRKPPASAPLP